ncbi:hypothetical protein B0O99DRAFT_615271, partial [Bisporella sp. PMI_857]
MAITRCYIQRRPSVIICNCHVGSVVEKQLDDVNMAIVRCYIQRRPSVLIRNRYVGSVVEK